MNVAREPKQDSALEVGRIDDEPGRVRREVLQRRMAEQMFTIGIRHLVRNGPRHQNAADDGAFVNCFSH